MLRWLFISNAIIFSRGIPNASKIPDLCLGHSDDLFGSDFHSTTCGPAASQEYSSAGYAKAC
jgi:hypothetical protein